MAVAMTGESLSGINGLKKLYLLTIALYQIVFDIADITYAYLIQLNQQK